VQLKGKRALITGSTSGIGLGISEALALNGCDVVLNGFGSSLEIESLVRRLTSQYHVHVRHVDADVSGRDACLSLAAEAKRELGGVDILVNNAGIQHVAPVEEFPAEQWDKIIATNLSSSFHLTAAMLPFMRNQDWGRIINVASVHGLVGSRFKAAYVAAKHGLVGLTKVVALECAGSGVTCNAICPGWVLTPLVEVQILKNMKEQAISRETAERELLVEKQPSRQFTTVQQIGALVVFLCSPAAENLTGACLPVDGAWTAQ
jgi:3-hydroxybutyrate dehydrogenase